MCVDLGQIPVSTIGSIAAWPIVSALTFLVQKIPARLQHYRFKAIFGEDALRASSFYVVYTDFTVNIVDQNGNPVRHIYIKSGTSGTPDAKTIPMFSIEKPVSGAGVRALGYLIPAIQTQSGEPVKISTDYDLEAEPDISFISFGGPKANLKTGAANRDDANNLVRFDEGGKGFVDLRTKNTIVEPEPRSNARHDYGLILKLQPKNHSKRTWIVCAGYDELGTSGAAWYLANNWKNIYKRAKKEPFAIVVKVECSKDKPKDKSAEVIFERYLHEEGSG